MHYLLVMTQGETPTENNTVACHVLVLAYENTYIFVFILKDVSGNLANYLLTAMRSR